MLGAGSKILMVARTSPGLRSAPTLLRHLRAHLISERARMRMSQAELAKRAKLARYTVVRIESGENTNPRLDVLVRIAAALEVPVHTLLEPIPPPLELSDEELAHRWRTTPKSEYVSADDVLSAWDEADGGERYSKRGRRRLAR
jgi:transcriptional regulator with XRE-family HTH domain